MAVEYVGRGGSDGVSVGLSSTEKVSVYGVTPVVQAGAITTLATTPTATDISVAVNAIIAAIKAFGITA